MEIKAGTQNEKIYNHLRKVGNISFVEAWTLYKVRSLPRRIADLKSAGVEISRQLRKDNTGQRYARYSLAS